MAPALDRRSKLWSGLPAHRVVQRRQESGYRTSDHMLSARCQEFNRSGIGQFDSATLIDFDDRNGAHFDENMHAFLDLRFRSRVPESFCNEQAATTKRQCFNSQSNVDMRRIEITEVLAEQCTPSALQNGCPAREKSST